MTDAKTLNVKQTAMIKEHLALVFTKITSDPEGDKIMEEIVEGDRPLDDMAYFLKDKNPLPSIFREMEEYRKDMEESGAGKDADYCGKPNDPLSHALRTRNKQPSSSPVRFC